MEGEWKSADEIAADLEAGEVDLRQVALGLWRRVEELQNKVDVLERQQDPHIQISS
ncbi:MAG: hypothetical protein V7606_3763 [Burkholderiales bacterium]|jgi:hypothetical protein